MKTIKALIIGLAVAGLTCVSQAVPLTGNYALSGGTANLNSPSVGTATGVVSWNGPITFTAIMGSVAAFNGETVTLDPWSFNSGAQVSLWETTSLQFDLLSSSVVTNTGTAIDVNGTGTLFVKGDLSTATPYTFNFTSQNPNIGPTGVGTWAFSFSASGNPVPEGGATALLLGLALLSVGAVRRFMVRA